MIIFLEKFNLKTFIELVFLRNIKVIYLLDSMDFYENHVEKKNNLEKIFLFLKPMIEIIRLPLYEENEFTDKNNIGICWRANKTALEFLDSDFFLNILRNKMEFILDKFDDERVFLAFKKILLPFIFHKILFYLQLEEMEKNEARIDKIISCNDDTFQLNIFLNHKIDKEKVSRINNFLGNLIDKIKILFFITLFPYLYRDVIKRGITLQKIRTKVYDLAIHLVWGFNLQIRSRKGDQKLNISDDLILENGAIDYSKTLFINHKWQFDNETYASFQNHLASLGSSETNLNELKIPISMFFKEYVMIHLKVFKNILSKILSGYRVNSLEVLLLQKIMMSYLTHELFCKYFRVKIFFSRDDYDFDHIVRTIIQNKYQLKNVGLQHNAFDPPYSLPFSAHTYFDKYYMFGPAFRKFWFPYWETNKSFLPVGTPREHEVIKARKNKKLREEFKKKFSQNTTILILFSKPDNRYSPEKLIYRKYKDMNKILDIDENIHIILKPRRQDAIKPFIELFPHLKKFFESDRVTLEKGKWTSQELMSYANILVAEDSSGCILEGVSNEDLVITSLRTRFPNHEHKNDISIEELSELIPIVRQFLKKQKVPSNIKENIDTIRGEFTTLPSGETWGRIADDISKELTKF